MKLSPGQTVNYFEASMNFLAEHNSWSINKESLKLFFVQSGESNYIWN